MTLSNGDLTTLVRVTNYIPDATSNSSSVLNQLISSASSSIYNKLNRGRLFSQTYNDIFDGVGNYQLLLRHYPVTNISAVQIGAAAISQYPLPTPGQVAPPNTFGYGWRCPLWPGELPGDPSMMEF